MADDEEQDDKTGALIEAARQLTRSGRAIREALDQSSGLSGDVSELKGEQRAHRERLAGLERAVRGDGNGDKGVIARLIRLEGDMERIIKDLGKHDDRRFQIGLLIGGTFLTAVGALVVALFKP